VRRDAAGKVADIGLILGEQMRLTKLEHACVRLEKDGVVLVIDPAAWSMPRALEGASAVLVTHEHFDHFDADGLRAALTADPGLQLWTNAEVASQFAGFSKDQVHVADDGDAFSVAGFDVHAYGHLHAVLHRDIPVIENTGFLIDGNVFHPGDSFTVPQDPVQTLLLPASGPWLKTGEMIDYAREVGPQRGYVIHEALFGDTGLMVLDNFLPMCGKDDTFRRVDVGAVIDL
jgi:L-ascorbate metabolism protein UlaG (beta-lactamase superfamily)